MKSFFRKYFSIVFDFEIGDTRPYSMGTRLAPSRPLLASVASRSASRSDDREYLNRASKDFVKVYMGAENQ